MILGDMGLVYQHPSFQGPELIDPLHQNLPCSLPPAHPHPVILASSVSTEENVLVCGGTTLDPSDGEGVADCYVFNGNQWYPQPSLHQRRHSAASVHLDPDVWWVGGGLDKDKILNSTEILILDDGVWEDGEVILDPIWSHCAAKVGISEILVTGGFATVEKEAFGWLNNKTYIMDVHKGNVTEVMTLHYPRAGMACVTLDDGSVLTAGGMDSFGNILDTVEVFDVKTKTWKVGPPLPVGSAMGKFVSIKDFGGPIFIGGMAASNAELSKLWHFSDKNWVELDIKLQKPRWMGEFILVQGKYLNCSGTL